MVKLSASARGGPQRRQTEAAAGRGATKEVERLTADLIEHKLTTEAARSSLHASFEMLNGVKSVDVGMPV